MEFNFYLKKTPLHICLYISTEKSASIYSKLLTMVTSRGEESFNLEIRNRTFYR